jgi:hypothetical protein
VVCADCGNENATMNRVCAYCGTRFHDQLTTITWRTRDRSHALPRGSVVWLVAALCAMLISLLMLVI